MQWTKQRRKKWNQEVVLGLFGEFDHLFHVQRFSDDHYRLTRWRDKMEMDYWPGTNKAVWHGFDEMSYFHIKDIEAYIHKKFIS